MPEQYAEYQPHEIRKLFDGHNKRIEAEDMRSAYYTHWLVNCQTTEHISPDDIYQPLHPSAGDRPMDKKKEADLLAHEFGLNIGPDGKIIKGKEVNA